MERKERERERVRKARTGQDAYLRANARVTPKESAATPQGYRHGKAGALHALVTRLRRK